MSAGPRGSRSGEGWQSGDPRRFSLVETSKNLQRATFVLSVFSFFCLITLFSWSDREILLDVGTAPVPLPWNATLEVPFDPFLVVAPPLLLAIAIYLHAFRRHLEALGRRETRAEQAPYLFNLKYVSGRLLSHLIFFWSTPAVLLLFAWKAASYRPSVTVARGIELPLVPLLVAELALATGWSVWMWRAEAAPEALKRRSRVGFGLLLAVGALTVVLLLGGIDGAMRLVEQDLSGEDLNGQQLAGADLRRADLSGANLSDADLSDADLSDVDLSGANLSGADLGGADLSNADLSGSVLETARNLQQWQLDAACGPLSPKSLPRGMLQPLPCDLREVAVLPQEWIETSDDERLNPRVRIVPTQPFLMGSPASDPDSQRDERPQRWVTLSPFQLQAHEVTRREWARFARQPEMKEGEEDLPVVGIPWHWANAYAAWLRGSLPTEAQWEYAARAGSTKRWSFGDGEKALGGHAWYEANSGGTIHSVTDPPERENALGLRDLHGNVWEWCLDWYSPSYPKGAETDPTGPGSGDMRVLRGGSAKDPAHRLRSAHRGAAVPTTRNWAGRDVGFRVAFPERRDPGPP